MMVGLLAMIPLLMVAAWLLTGRSATPSMLPGSTSVLDNGLSGWQMRYGVAGLAAVVYAVSFFLPTTYSIIKNNFTTYPRWDAFAISWNALWWWDPEHIDVFYYALPWLANLRSGLRCWLVSSVAGAPAVGRPGAVVFWG